MRVPVAVKQNAGIRRRQIDTQAPYDNRLIKQQINKRTG